MTNKIKKESLQDKLSKNLPVPPEEKTTDIDDDYEFSRETYRNLVDKGQHAIDDMMQLASEAEHPRAYEVLGNMLKNVSDMTDKLMDLQKNKKKLEDEEKKETSSVTNNNLFVGSTTELQKMLHNEKPIDHE